MLAKINKILEYICVFVAGCAIIFMGAIAFVDSIGRPLAMPLPGASEMVSFALMLFFFSALPIVILYNAHIRVGLLTDLYGPRGTRIEAYITGIAELLAMLLLSWMVYDQGSRLTRFGTLSTYFEVPMAPWTYIAFAFTAIGAWFALVTIGRNTRVDDTPSTLEEENS